LGRAVAGEIWTVKPVFAPVTVYDCLVEVPAETVPISLATVTFNISLITEPPIAEKEGQFIYYSLNTTVVDEIMKWLLQIKTKKK
jgi:hypothetical protein